MEAGDPASRRDDFEIAVDDMETPASSRLAGSSWHRQRVALPRPVLAALVAALVALALLTALSTGGQLAALLTRPTPIPTLDLTGLPFPTRSPTPPRPTPTPTPSPYPTPTLIAPVIRSVPQNCPPVTPLVAFDPDASGPGIGGLGVWLTAGGLFGPRAIVHLGSLSPSAYTPYGWPIGIWMYVKPDFTQTITVVGHDLHTGYVLWLSPGPNPVLKDAAPTLTIDPSQPQGSTGNAQHSWNNWFSFLYLPGAGCYTLQASWPGGGWSVNFAAGR